MSQTEQQTQLYGELAKVIDRFIEEYDLTVPSVVGILEILKTEIMLDSVEGK